MAVKLSSRQRRKFRIRNRISGSTERPRLTVFRTATHIYAQVIDDGSGKTLAAASTLTAELVGAVGDVDKTAAARKVGALVAKRCLEKSIAKVVFDRNGYLYHGRVKALAEAAREGGLEF
jgi:large subunit ribosomal protein L18